MVEAGANEISEAEILDALDIAHARDQAALRGPARAAQEGRQGEGRGRRRRRSTRRSSSELKERFGAALDAGDPGASTSSSARTPPSGSRRRRSRRSPATPTTEATRSAAQAVQLAFDKLEKDIIRKRIAVDKKRPDGRAADEIREIWIEVGVAPRTHGSAIFTRGQTQAFSVAALGTTRDEMRLDTLGLAGDQALLPPLQLPAVLGGRGRLHARPQAPRHRPRRARRARARAGGADDRTSSRTRSAWSRTSSSRTARRSMASVCGSTLSLMDAGVPIKAPVAGSRDGPDQGGRRLHRPHRHRGRGGPPRRHGLQGRRHLARASPPCRWTSRSRA